MAKTPHRYDDEEDDKPTLSKTAPPIVPAKTEQKAEPEKIVTVQEEQLARSAEIEAMGVEKWKEAHSTKPPVVEEPAPKAKG